MTVRGGPIRESESGRLFCCASPRISVRLVDLDNESASRGFPAPDVLHLPHRRDERVPAKTEP